MKYCLFSFLTIVTLLQSCKKNETQNKSVDDFNSVELKYKLLGRWQVHYYQKKVDTFSIVIVKNTYWNFTKTDSLIENYDNGSMKSSITFTKNIENDWEINSNPNNTSPIPTRWIIKKLENDTLQINSPTNSVALFMTHINE